MGFDLGVHFFQQVHFVLAGRAAVRIKVARLSERASRGTPLILPGRYQ